MAAATAVIPPSGLEDGVSRARGEGAGEAVVERGPGAAYHMFVVMEDLVEKLKLLRYEEELLRKSNLKPPSRCVLCPRRPVLARSRGCLSSVRRKSPSWTRTPLPLSSLPRKGTSAPREVEFSDVLILWRK